ncbi:MAG: xanthine dehydrogenase small subunit [Rhodoferax sp.]|nr:xanthine dehydrogenase small subunit [Rhodoferax sp.]
MKNQTLKFLRNGKIVSLDGVDPSRTLLEVLREDLHCSGTKEGCGEGDCGACTVVVGEAQGKTLKTSAINSCIRLAHSIHGMAVWTVEDLTNADGSLHPVQQAVVDCHGSQCGFCTPGFVMSLFGLYQNHTAQGKTVSREQAQQALSGNLCRCTGYRPLLDAAQTMQNLPAVPTNSAQVVAQLRQLADSIAPSPAHAAYKAPNNLGDLLAARQRNPQAQLVAGCTDVGLWVTKGHRQFEQVLDITQVAELRQIERYPHHLAIGAAVTLTDAFAALVAERPQLQEFAQRFAGLPVRNSGTLGGNVANGSPIGDSMPLLIALGANVVLLRRKGMGMAHRELQLEDLYTGYRQNVMAPDEVLAWIKVPRPVKTNARRKPVAPCERGEFLRVYKVSKRFEDDISAVCLAVRLQIEKGVVQTASIGVGGVAATPVRARLTEAALRGQTWNPATVEAATQVLCKEFSPISDMRASAAYRRTVLGNLMQRYWLESQGEKSTRLHQIDVQELEGLPLDLEGASA